MSEQTITLSRASLQELESRIHQILLISDKLDILSYEMKQISGYLKKAYKSLEIKEKVS